MEQLLLIKVIVAREKVRRGTRREMSGDRPQLSGLSAVSGLAQEVDVFIFHDVSEVKSASQSNKSKQENSSACVQNVCVCVSLR